MGRKSSARGSTHWRSNSRHVWLDHNSLTPDDLNWLADVEMLTLWAVKIPDGLFAQLPRLRFLDLRGGSGVSLDLLTGSTGLECLVVNQVRGLADLTTIEDLTSLRALSLYGLPRVTTLPNLAVLRNLVRLDIGSMKGLDSLAPSLAAPALEELSLIRTVNMAPDDPERIRDAPTLAKFYWFAEDVPDTIWQPVIDLVGKPAPTAVSAEQWFAEHGDMNPL